MYSYDLITSIFKEIYSTQTILVCIAQNQVPVQIQQARVQNTLEPGIWICILVNFQLENANGMQVANFYHTSTFKALILCYHQQYALVLLGSSEGICFYFISILGSTCLHLPIT